MATVVEQRLLYALAQMSEQYLGTPYAGTLDHSCMSAGEEAFKALAAFGLITASKDRSAAWTDAGRDLLDLKLASEPFPR